MASDYEAEGSRDALVRCVLARFLQKVPPFSYKRNEEIFQSANHTTFMSKPGPTDFS